VTGEADDRQSPDSPSEIVWAEGERLRTWGRWGDDDERGTLNYITSDHRVTAAGLVRRGAVFSLALPIRNGQGPMIGKAGRFNPLHHMTVTGEPDSLKFDCGGNAGITDDLLVMGLQSGTQWDALCHVYYNDRLYNGFAADSVTQSGAAHGGIDNVHSEFVGRGVLLDIPRHGGVTELDPGYAITSDDLDRCAAAQSVKVGEGDLVVIRTGSMTRVDGDDWSRFHAQPRAGLHYETASWMSDRRIAAVAMDNNAVEAPSPLEGVRYPLHMLALRDMGVHLGEYWYLEDLAADCAADGVWDFMLVAQALPIEGATGSPVNPIAIK
jgi:kynurenine formamidase